jgi:hypothetical protein
LIDHVERTKKSISKIDLSILPRSTARIYPFDGLGLKIADETNPNHTFMRVTVQKLGPITRPVLLNA